MQDVVDVREVPATAIVLRHVTKRGHLSKGPNRNGKLTCTNSPLGVSGIAVEVTMTSRHHSVNSGLRCVNVYLNTCVFKLYNLMQALFKSGAR